MAVATEPDPLRAVELEQDSVAVGLVAAIVHVGVPVGVIPSVPVTVAVKVSVVPLSERATATVGVALPMVIVRVWVALPATFVALTQTIHVPAEPEGGVPDTTPPALSEMPEVGVQPENAVLENVGAGVPVAVAVKLPGVPTVKFVELALVITGAWFTVRVNVCVPEPTEFVALMQAV